MPVRSKTTGSGKINPGPAGEPGTAKPRGPKPGVVGPAKPQKKRYIMVGTSKPFGPAGSRGENPGFWMLNESRMRQRGCKRVGNPGDGK